MEKRTQGLVAIAIDGENNLAATATVIDGENNPAAMATAIDIADCDDSGNEDLGLGAMVSKLADLELRRWGLGWGKEQS
ncbi:unnamed protein product [Linum tenue]|uniref:Uncharacterized protein n=1 Tax=Linum tenue TaxID=586396 RepID=A0AAV0R7L0_9ROSI|nr:unnamed protein product [Linum tenue]CAI0553649.1 unnamed protein product [Linum tenue]